MCIYLTLWQVVEALVGVGERLGVKYRLSTPISSVTVSPDGRTATGVQLESGEHLSADVVIINADLVYAYNKLLPPSSRAKQLSKRAASCSSISFYWAMDRVIPELMTHNIFLADAYRESFDDIFKRQLMPAQPSFYVNVPSRADPTAAPPGKDTVVVLVPVGHLLEDGASRGLEAHSEQDWERMVEYARETVFATIEARTGAKDLRAAVKHEEINTPRSWKERFNLDKGAILGISHSFFNVLSFRPGTKHPDIDRCYFVGASTHPGTGVPVCVAGSKVTSEQVLQDLGLPRPWSDGGGVAADLTSSGLAPSGKGRTGIDRIQPLTTTTSLLSPLILLLLFVFVGLSFFVFPTLASPAHWLASLSQSPPSSKLS